MRRALQGCLIGLLVGLPISAAAGVGGGSGAAENQAFKYRDTPISTTSTVFQDIPGLSGLVICADKEASVTVSLGATGAP